MTAKVWLMLLLAQAAAGMVCPPHICENTQCPPVKACHGRLSTEGSFCGCCKVCIQQLGFGEPCTYLPFLGVPSTSQCAKGLMCDPYLKVCIPLLWYIARQQNTGSVKTSPQNFGP